VGVVCWGVVEVDKGRVGNGEAGGEGGLAAAGEEEEGCVVAGAEFAVFAAGDAPVELEVVVAGERPP